MDVTAWDEQVAADAVSANGEPTVAPFPGALTVTPFAELAVAAAVVVVAAVVVAVAVVVTVTGTSAMHTAPPLPHAFTCTACEPVVAVTVALTEVPLTIVVLLLLSSENPIEETVWFEQVVAVADSGNCVETFAPLAGVLTVTLANAGIAQVASRVITRENFLSKLAVSFNSVFPDWL